MIQELNITTKQNNAEHLEATQNIPADQKMTAEEINATVGKVNELVQEVNKKATNLDNPNNDNFPTTKAAADALATKQSKGEKAELQITSAVDVHNADAQGKGLLSFTQAIKVTGVKSTGFYDGQEIAILNLSAGSLTIVHMSGLSFEANRIFSVTGQNVVMKPNSFIILRYSQTRNRLEVVTVFGTDILPGLAYAGSEQRVVTITPDGVCYAEPIMEYEVFDDSAAGFGSLTAVATAYPTAQGFKKGFQVVCAYMTPPTLYKKCGDGDDNWVKFTGTKMT